MPKLLVLGDILVVVEISRKNVLVAGGAGFVGSTLVRCLLDKGANVWSFDDYSIGREYHLPEHPNLTSCQGDACDLDVVMELFGNFKFELVYHCIGDTYVPEAYDFPERFFARNLGTTLNFLKAAKNHSSLERMLYVSSTEVYGDTNEDFSSEACNLTPSNTYAVSKLAADRLCYTYSVEHNVPTIIARIFNCYGPRATHEYIIPEIIRQLHNGSVLELGNVDTERDFTYVEDTAKALIDLSCSNLPHGDVANIGSDHAISVRDLVKLVGQTMGIDEIEIKCDPARLRRNEVYRFCADSSKLREATGWQPTVTLEDGLRSTVDWYRENGQKWAWMQQ
jgi:nucleoside-diphosphate-sugar epimerase